VFKTTTIGALALLIPQVCLGADTSAMSVDDIKECVERSLPAKSSVQHVTLRTTDSKGGTRESKAKVYWAKREDGRSRALIRFSAPSDLRGSALLLLERSEGHADMFMYLPEFDKVRRITTRTMSGGLFGTDFNYEEFERLYGVAGKMENRRLPDARIGDRPVFVLESLPGKGDGSGSYERIVEYIEQERCTALKIEFFEGSGDPSKVLTIDPASLHQLEGAWMADRILMQDLRKGSKTTLDATKVEVNVEIPERTFSQGALNKRR